MGTTGKVGRGRRTAAWVLLVVAVLLTPITLGVRWVNFEVSDADRFVATLGPLAEDPEVQQAVADRLSTEIVNAIDVEQLAEDALPTRAAFLAAPLTGAVEDFADQEILALLETEQFAQIWREALRIAHEAADALLSGKDDGGIQVEDGRVILDLKEFADVVIERLSDRGLTIVEDIPTDSINTHITLFESQTLADAQTAVELLNTLSWVLLVVALVFFALSAVLLGDARRGLLRIGIGLLIGGLLLALGLAVGRGAYLDAVVAAGAKRSVQQIVFDQVVGSLRVALRATIALGIILAIGAWVTGPSGAATRVRGFTSGLLGKGADGVSGTRVGDVGVLRWLGAHERAVEIVVLVLAAFFLLSWQAPSAATVLWLALFTLVLLALVAVGARAGRAGVRDGAAEETPELSEEPEPVT
jgi:hypothetical protein